MRIKNALLTIVLIALPGCARCLAQQAGAGFTLEQVLSSPFPSDLIASRTGRRVAWVFDSKGRRNIWVAEGPQFVARQLTSYTDDDGQELSDLAFTPDGDWIVYVRGGDRNRAGEVPNPLSNPAGARQQIYAVSWKDGQQKLLSEGHSPAVSATGDKVAFSRDNRIWLVTVAGKPEPFPLFSARGNNGSPQWSPDGRQLAFVSARGDHGFIGVFDQAKNSISFLAPSVDRDSFPRWSGDSKRIAFVRQPALGNQPEEFLADRPDPWSILVADAATGAAREVWQSAQSQDGSLPFMAGDNLLQWAAGDRLVFASEQDGWMHLYTVSAGGGSPQLLTPGRCEVENITRTPDRQSIIYSSNCGDIDRRHLWRVPVSGGAPATITAGEGIEWSPVVTGDGSHLIYFASDARRPAMPRVMPLAGRQSMEIASSILPADFPSAQLVTPQQVIFNSADGLEVHSQLFLPPGVAAGTRLPAVIFMHGGPIRQMLLGWHYFYYYHNSYAFNQYLASRGYAVLSVNYRSGIGYGRAFRMAPRRGVRGASEYQDVVAAARYLRGRADIDARRIGLWGGSYGGYLTALGLARNSDLFAAGVDMHGVHDWSIRISGASWLDYANQEAKKVAFESSPVSSVSGWRSPVLLIQGDDDRNVSFAQMVDLARRLREQRVPFDQLVFPDEVHDFLLHRHWLQAYEASSAFFDRHLKARSDEIPAPRE